MNVCAKFPCHMNLTSGYCQDQYCPMRVNLPPTYSAPPMGCICPPTSEQTCESVICPRKNHLRNAPRTNVVASTVPNGTRGAGS